MRQTARLLPGKAVCSACKRLQAAHHSLSASTDRLQTSFWPGKAVCKPASPQAPINARIHCKNKEQISGSENAPIARFDGLGCYQSRSEKAAGAPERSGGVARGVQ